MTRDQTANDRTVRPGRLTFGLVHLAVAAALAAATVTAIGLVDMAGAAGSGTASVLVPIVPCRLVDTRAGQNNVGARATPLGATEVATFAVWGTNGNCTIPTSATGIATNATAVNPTSDSYITLYPSDADPRPTASNLNVVAGGAPTPNQATIGLSAGGMIAAYNNGGTVDLVIDIVGYYQAATAGTGPQGPQGPQGVQGPAGPACPASGCTTFFSGNDFVGAAGNPISYVGAGTCSYGAYTQLGLTLPAGAIPTKATVRYKDGDGSPAGEGNMAVYKAAFTASDPLVTANGKTKTNETTLDLTFTGATTPVGPDSTYYLSVASGERSGWCRSAVSLSRTTTDHWSG